MAEATPDEPRSGPEDPGGRGRIWSFAVDKGMPLATAVLTVLAAALGVWGVQANDEKDELADSVDVLESERDLLAEDKASLAEDLAEAIESRDEWKARAEEAAESTTTTTEPEGPGGPGEPPDPVEPGAAGVFRETGAEPVTFAYSYGIDLDTREDNWGVSSSGGDVSLSKHSDGLSLFVPSRTIAVVDAPPTYDDCEAQTVLQESFNAELTTVGTQACIRTSEGRWAYVNIIGVDAARETVTLHIVVWTLQT